MPTIVGIGEALFDVYPDGARRLGGATLNFAVHAQQLQARIRGQGIPVTRIGSDGPGREIVESLRAFSIDTAGVQVDPERPTGTVQVRFKLKGAPTYDIVPGVAWDAIEFDNPARELAARCDAVCFGTLAQRDPLSRASIQKFVEAAPQAFRMCDINLRQNYFDAPLIRRSLEMSNAAKLNDEEIYVVAGLFDFAGSHYDVVNAMLRGFGLDYVILTRGSRGTFIYTKDAVHEGERVAATPAPDADPVGAGDACAAAVVVGLLLGHSPARTADFANHIGAYVASRRGGTPELPENLLVKPDCTFPV